MADAVRVVVDKVLAGLDVLVIELPAKLELTAAPYAALWSSLDRNEGSRSLFGHTDPGA